MLLTLNKRIGRLSTMDSPAETASLASSTSVKFTAGFSLVLILLVVLALVMGMLGSRPGLRTRGVAAQRAGMYPPPAAHSHAQVMLAKLTLPFIVNRGQVDARVAYYAPDFAGTLYVTRRGLMVYSLPARRTIKSLSQHVHPDPTQGWTLTERFLTDHCLTPLAVDPSVTRVSYFIGNQPAKWRRNLPTVGSLDLGEVWPGIRVGLRAQPEGMETLYHLAPGAEPGRIRIAVGGVQTLQVKDSRLLAETGLGQISLPTPRAWQIIRGRKLPVSVSYTIQAHTYGFRLGAYSPSASVDIDPEFQASFLDGAFGGYIALDAAGDVYVAGTTYSTDFPGTTGGAQSTNNNAANGTVFIAKLNPGLTAFEQATYLGGSDSGGDTAYALALDGAGDVYVSGTTFSVNFPGTAGGAQPTYQGQLSNYNGGGTSIDGFVAKINGSLTTLEQATYLSGSQNHNGEDLTSNFPMSLAVDSGGDLYVGGMTDSINFPGTTGGAQTTNRSQNFNAFVAKLNEALTVIDQATYLGGSYDSTASALAVDAGGDVYAAGENDSSDFPGTSGGAQTTPGGAYIAKLNAGLTGIDQATYISGAGIGALVLDAMGNVYVTGPTSGPVVSPGPQGPTPRPFVAKLNSLLTNIEQYTVVTPGNVEGGGTALALDAAGDVYVAGGAGSPGYPDTAGGVQPNYAGGGDAFILKMNSTLTTVEQATYLGGSGDDEASGLAIDAGGDVYVTGSTSSADFPGTLGGAQVSPAGNFVAKLPGDLKAVPVIMNVSMDAPAQTNVGSNFSYILNVVNNSPDTQATGVMLTDPLPSAVSFVSATTSANEGGCTDEGATVSCDLANLPAAGGSASVTISVKATGSGTAANTAYLQANEPFDTGSTDSASVNTAIPAPPHSGGGGGGLGIVELVLLLSLAGLHKRKR